jgi:catechol 2,3-dioxygenase-like lactoylglutathione lyase family enzyme
MTPQLNLIGLTATDLAATLAFYRRLGLDIPEGAEKDDHVEVTLASGVRIAWDSADLIRQIDPEWTPASGSPRMGIAFLCESPEGVDEAYRHMVEGGFQGHQEPWDAFWGQRYATLRDPDGNGVDLFAALPTS